MRCPTCGENLEPGASRCPVCGSAVRRQVVVATDAAPDDIRQCPRCGYHGRGVPYFSRGGHVGLLVCVSLFTYGIGGIAYWLARRQHRICRNCGLGWENAIRSGLGGGERSRSSLESGERTELPSSGLKRRALGVLIVVGALVMIGMGVAMPEAAVVVIGSVLGAAGTGTFFWGWKALQERRQAVRTRLHHDVLRLATRRGGTLTVTEVAAELDLTMELAEKVLIAMDDGFRVRSDITMEGVLVYEFPEVIYRRELSGDEEGRALPG